MRCFIDSNVWLYAFIEGQDRAKTVKASALIRANEPVVSTQVVNETCVNLLRRAAFTEEDVRGVVASSMSATPCTL
jgi:predicted nucleic acid-binding protein